MQTVTDKLDAVCLAAQIILESGGETYRAEETVEKMCQGFDLPKVNVFALPTGLILTVASEDAPALTRLVRVRNRASNLARLDQCNHISRQVAEGKLSARDALSQLKALYALQQSKKTLLVLASALSAGGFTVMLGGLWPDFIISFFCGVVVQWVQFSADRMKVPALLSGLIAGALTAFMAMLGSVLFPSVQVEPIIAGAIMPLLPGLATTNGIRDTMRGDLVSGGARIVEAVLCALMLGAGIALVLSLWGGIQA